MGYAAEVYDRLRDIRPRGLTSLTPRQTEVMRYGAAGAKGSEIAHAMGISTKTVGHHFTAIYAELGAHNRAEAVALLDDRAPGWRRWT